MKDLSSIDFWLVVAESSVVLRLFDYNILNVSGHSLENDYLVFR